MAQNKETQPAFSITKAYPPSFVTRKAIGWIWSSSKIHDIRPYTQQKQQTITSYMGLHLAGSQAFKSQDKKSLYIPQRT